MKDRKLSVIAIVIFLTLCACSDEKLPDNENFTETSHSETAITEKTPDLDWEYSIVGNKASIKRYTGDETIVTVPEALEGCPVTVIHQKTFADSNVTTLTIPENVLIKSLSGAKKLVTLNLPKSTKELSVSNFTECDSLAEINIPEGNELYRSENGVLYSADGKTLVMFPQGRSGSFEVPEGVENIGRFAFYQSSLSEIKLPDSLETIDSHAFHDTALSELFIPDSVSEIGKVILGYESSVSISVSADKFLFTTLLEYENLTYRNDTMLRRAVRRAQMRFSGDYYTDHRLIFTDMDKDSFPELMILSNDRLSGIYKYSDEEGWQTMLCHYYDYPECLELYYDKSEDSYFYIFIGIDEGMDVYEYAEYLTFDESGNVVRENYGSSGIEYPMGEYSDGFFQELSGGGTFKIAEYPPEFPGEHALYTDIFADFREFIESTLSGYEIVSCLEANEAFEYYNEKFPRTEEGVQLCFDGEFADTPTNEGYNFSKAPETLFTIGERSYNSLSPYASLDNEDICPESFEKLSQLPCLTTLHIYGSGNIDLTGIEKLE
ncbi:MAG: leucine-rich repeat domain-containing protein, partial [Huintestinicola sp.]